MTFISISIGCTHIYIINIGMLDDEDQFIISPDLEGRGSGGRDRICASLNSPFQWNRGFFQGDFWELLPSNTYQLISRWFSCNSSNNNCLCWFYHIINCAIGFTLALYSHCFLILNHSIISQNEDNVFMSLDTISPALVWCSVDTCNFLGSQPVFILSLISPLLAVCVTSSNLLYV